VWINVNVTSNEIAVGRLDYLKPSWNSTEKTRPNARCSCSGTTAYQSTDDNSRDISQKKALTINMIILMGSAAMVNINMASGGPKARQAQPKKSMTVIFFSNGRDEESRFPFLFSSFTYILCQPALTNAKLSYKISSKPLYGPDTVCFYRAHLSSRYRARSDTRQIIVSVCFLIEDTNAQVHWNQSPSHSCDNLPTL